MCVPSTATQKSLSPSTLVGTETGEVTDCPQERPSCCQRTEASSHQGETCREIEACLYCYYSEHLVAGENLHAAYVFLVMGNFHMLPTCTCALAGYCSGQT